MKNIKRNGKLKDVRKLKYFIYRMWVINDGIQRTLTSYIIKDTQEQKAVNILEKYVKENKKDIIKEFNLEEGKEIDFSCTDYTGYHDCNLTSYRRQRLYPVGERIVYESFYKITFDVVYLDTEHDYIVKTKRYIQEAVNLEVAIERFNYLMKSRDIKNIKLKSIEEIEYKITDIL